MITQKTILTGEFKRIAAGTVPAGIPDSGGTAVPAPVYDLKEDFREFNKQLSRRMGYVGFGDEGENCGRWGVLKACENGHFILKHLVCGREWCPECGQDNSAHHNRRVMRLKDRVFGMNSVGYMVLQVPLVSREAFKSVEMLRAARRYIHRLLSREFHTRGVSRWHYYGEARISEFDGELEYTHYHPHLNVLMDHGFMGKKQYKRIRRLWSQWVYRECGKRYYKTAPVYYRYHKAPGKRWHLVNYITRSTFKELNEGNRAIAKGLFSFNNTSWFGTFTEAEKSLGNTRFERWIEALPERERTKSVIQVAAHESFNANKCPICSAPMVQCGLGAGEGGKTAVERCSSFEYKRAFGGGLYEVSAPFWASSHYAELEVVQCS